MKTFELLVRVYGTVEEEDPKCPIGWIGSGCYTIEIPARCDVVVEVNADSEDEAREIAEEYSYFCDKDWPMYDFREARVVRVSEICECRDDDQNEGVVYVKFYDPDTDPYEPDPDDED